MVDAFSLLLKVNSATGSTFSQFLSVIVNLSKVSIELLAHYVLLFDCG